MIQKQRDEPFVPAKAGELISAEDWNKVQLKTIERIDNSVDGLRTEIFDNDDPPVAKAKEATNASALDNKSFSDLVTAVAEAVADLQLRSRHMEFFAKLGSNKEVQIAHKLGHLPNVTLYELVELTFKPDDGAANVKEALVCLCEDTETNDLVEATTKHPNSTIPGTEADGQAIPFTEFVEKYDLAPENATFKTVSDNVRKHFGIKSSQFGQTKSIEGKLENEGSQIYEKLLKEQTSILEDIYLAWRPKKLTVPSNDINVYPLDFNHITIVSGSDRNVVVALNAT